MSEEPVKMIRCPFCGNEIPEGSTTCFICGEELKTNTEPVYKYAAGDEYDRIERVRDTGNKNSFLIILGLFILAAIVGLIIVCNMRDPNNDGVYYSDDIRPFIKKYCTQNGIEYSEKDVEYENSITVNGSQFEWKILIRVKGIPIHESLRTGTIYFRNNKVRMYLDGYEYGTTGNYVKGQSITLFMDEKTSTFYELDKMTFTKK
jgi:uncharacterized membrane protein YvbJ